MTFKFSKFRAQTALSLKCFARAFKGSVLAVALGLAAPSFDDVHATGSPFANLSGFWSGPGVITLASGAKENIRCRATYKVDDSGANLQLTLRCASESYTFELQSNVAHNAGEVSGTWAEMTRHIGGTISGNTTGSRMQINVQGALAANLDVNTRANQQSISIDSPGSEMSQVEISLNRGSK